jgi:hypothetical protein
MNQYFKTFRPSPFAYFLVTVVISYLLWTLLPDENQSWALDFCKENLSYVTNNLIPGEMWNELVKLLTELVNRAHDMYYKYIENVNGNPSFRMLP